MRIAIAAAGGGHFSPALAVIEALPKDTAVLVIGRKYALEGDTAVSLEYKTAQKRNIPFYTITTGRLQRKFTRHSVPSLAKLPLGFGQAVKALREFQPTVVLSFGGYISLPVIFAAALYRIPVVIHEQTLGVGLANKIAAKFANRICISWGSSAKYFPKAKTVLTGNPLRMEVREPQKSDYIAGLFAKTDEEKPLVYITGGSLGSHPINQLIEQLVPRLAGKYRVIHQTGGAKEYGDYERLTAIRESLSEDLKKRYHVRTFLDPLDAGYVMQQADVVIGRSGVGTVTELLHFGKPCLLIPLPHAQHNEQLQNALFLKEHGIAMVVSQENLTSDIFLTKLNELMKDIEKYRVNGKKASAFVPLDAADKVVAILREVERV